MKKFRTMLAMMLAMMSLCVAFSSCSDDDDDEPKATPAAQLVAGTYQDDMTCTVMGTASTYENLTVTVTATSETTVDIVLPSFGEGSMTLPEITLTGVKVTSSESSISTASDLKTATIAEQEFSGTSDAGKDYTCTLTGSYTGGTLTLNYSLQYGAMPMAMVCSFTATKK